MLQSSKKDVGSRSAENPGAPEKTKKMKRRAVACKACHALKVKCIPSDPTDSKSVCVRCEKSMKPCEIESPQVRKKKRPEDRVAELELRLEQLTSQLNQGSSPISQSSESSLPQPSPRNQSLPHFNNSFQSYSPLVNPAVATQRSSSVRNKQSAASTPNEYVSESETPEQHRRARTNKARLIEERFGPKKLQDISSAVTAANEIRVGALTLEVVDIIDSGYITLEEARIRYDLYQNTVFEKYPFVSIPDDFETLRKDQRILFMTLMAVMGTLRPSTEVPDIETNMEILNLAQKQILNDVMFIGNKSMELLKSLLLYTVWYNAPEMFHHRRYHIFSGLCISLCHDLGLTGRPYYVVSKSDGAFRRSMVLEEPQKEEYRSLVSTVYCLSTGYMLFLRRKLPVTWSPYLEECSQLLRNSTERRYRTIGVMSKLTSLMEKIDMFLNSQDQDNHPLIKHFAMEIEMLRAEPTTLEDNVLKAFSSSIEAFLYSKFSSKVLSLKCLQSTMDCIESFSDMRPEEMNSVPLLIFGRLMYCFALFLKTCNNLKYDFDLVFIERLLDKMRVCTETYKNNHIVLKIRLLLHFYLTTFAKNEDVFNSINEVSTAYSVAKDESDLAKSHTNNNGKRNEQQPQRRNGKQPTANSGPELHPSHSVPNLSSVLSGARNPRPQSDHLQHSLSQQINQSTVQHTPPSTGAINQLPLPLPLPLRSNNVNSSAAYNVMPMGVTVQANNALAVDQFGIPYQGTNEFPGEPSYPRLDMLSDATMNGFLDVPNDLLWSQDDFWRLFDYKQDDQFYL